MEMSNYTDFERYGYRIERALGQNWQGGRVTYLARKLTTQRSVVIKQYQFAQSSGGWEEYDTHHREIQVLQQLSHPNIPRYLESFETPTGFCLVQEYKKACSLAQPRHFNQLEIKKIALGVLTVLEYLQSACPPIIHRDVKPENILVDRSHGFQIYLVDFGFAHWGDKDVAVSSVVKGTLGFMPPEQLFNRTLTDASDLYSLGVTLVCLLTSTKSNDVGTLVDENSRLDFKQLPSTLNPQFGQWLKKMTAHNLKQRYKNAREALKALKSIDVTATNAKKRSVAAGLIGLGMVAALSAL